MTTVIIPYNKDRGYLNEAIASVNAQTVKCKLILSHADATCAVNLKNGLDKVDTEFYAILAEDDLLSPNFIKIMESVIGNNDFAIANGVGFGVSEYVYKSQCTGLKDLLQKNTIHGGAVLYRTDSVRKAGGYDLKLFCAEEYDLHLRLLANGAKFIYTDSNVYLYRRHTQQKYKVDTERRKREINYIKQKHENSFNSNI